MIPLLLLGAALAHDFKPGLLEVVEGELVLLRWTPPRTGAEGLSLEIPAGCTADPAPFPPSMDCPEGLVGEIGIRGLTRASGDVLLRVQRAQGVTEAVLHAGTTTLALSSPPTGIGAWVGLGFGHVLSGADHLAFVAGLVLLVAGLRRLLLTLTAFTLGHSLTLALATLGGLSLPGPPVEAAISLSVMLLAFEILHPAPTLTQRWPGAVAGGFGLLHGLGFAGALREIGIPLHGAARTLVGFNLGVELGQVAVVSLALPLAFLLRRGPTWIRPAPAILLGALATAWTLERIVAFWAPS